MTLVDYKYAYKFYVKCILHANNYKHGDGENVANTIA